MFSGKTFLITGATGRLGCEAATRLEKLGARVLPIVLKGYPLLPKRVKWSAKTSPIIINTFDDLQRMQFPDFVINFHWRVNRTLAAATQLLYEIDNNINLPRFLWDWLLDKPLHSFLNISSIKVFSYLNKNPISAEIEPRPITPYGIAKVSAEKFFDAHFRNATFRVVHLRLCSVASFGEHPSHLFSQLYQSAFNNLKITIRKSSSCIIYINDVVDLIVNAALKAQKPHYIIAAPIIPNYAIAEKFAEVTGYKINADYIDPSLDNPDPIYISDLQDLRANWTRHTPLEDMIRLIVKLHNHCKK